MEDLHSEMVSFSPRPSRMNYRWNEHEKQRLYRLHEKEGYSSTAIAEELSRSSMAVDKRVSEMKNNGEWDDLRQRSGCWSVAEVQRLLYSKLVGQHHSESMLPSRTSNEIESQWCRILPVVLNNLAPQMPNHAHDSGINKEGALQPFYLDQETYTSHARSVSEGSVPLRQPWPVRSTGLPVNLASWDDIDLAGTYPWNAAEAETFHDLGGWDVWDDA